MKRRRKSKFFIVIIVLLLTIITCIIFYFHITNKFEYRNKITIEVGEDIPTIEDYFYEKKYESTYLVWNELPSEDGKVYKVGTYSGYFMYKGEEKKVILVVKDTTPPVISGVKDIEMLAYDSIPEFLKDITVIDNSNEEIIALVNGDYNPDVVGEYTMYYTAEDSSGNVTEEKFKLTVKENKNVTISKSTKGYTIKKYYDITYIENNIIVNKTYSLPSNYVPNNLVYINGYIRVVDYVKKSFDELVSDATSIGLNIYASSGYRSYNDQNYIYNNYVRIDGKDTADTYSARAGYSEHQTGLAIDLNTVDASFDNTKESQWLKEHCYEYGFIIRYPKGKDKITGYMYEPWHIRYVGKELAEKLYNKGNWLTLEEYYGIDSEYKE